MQPVPLMLVAAATVTVVVVVVAPVPPMPPSPLVVEVSPGVDAFLLRTLDRNPEARFQSARELAAALTLLASPTEPRSLALSITSEASAVAAVTAPHPFTVTAAPRPERPWSPPSIEPGTLTSSSGERRQSPHCRQQIVIALPY